MTRRFLSLAVCVLVCALLALASCRRAENRPPDPQPTITTDSARSAPVASSAPSFTPTPLAAQDSARAGLLRRKGELLMARKKVLASSEMTRAQKDSALRAIEQESVQLSKQLLDAGH